MTKLPVAILEQWQRIIFSDQPVYIQPERPDWLVPGLEADRLLQNPVIDPSASLARDLLLNQMASPAPQTYKGRAPYLTLDKLRECWFHLTSKCNLSCQHCLFESSPDTDLSITPELLQKGIREARDLGCNLFYFTGGEPFVYPDFTRIIGDLLKDPEVHVVILTNGLLIDKHLDAIKKMPPERLHLQISLDGLEEHHDLLRGAGTFPRLMSVLDTLANLGLATTLSVAVNKVNLSDLAEITRLAAKKNITNLHFLWHFIRGKGTAKQFVTPAEIFPRLLEAQKVAEQHQITIDNIETLRSQIFSSPGTRFDLSNTAWESLTIGPDGKIYPSPALVGIVELAAGELSDGLEKVWRQSPVLEKIRSASLIDSPEIRKRPLHFLTGGGDIDHSFLHSGKLTGHDPYLELYEQIALWLITNQVRKQPAHNTAEIRLRMGDVRHDCPDGGQEVSLTHCNCVISISVNNGHRSVKEFYGMAAQLTNEEITNPFGPESKGLEFIPTESKKRSYGCGSPISDAFPEQGETLVDLGSGSGVECFIGAEKVGPRGKVFGIDMTDEMLELARESQSSVAERLGYDNLEFRRGYLEDIPLDDDLADVVISNCVINLSPDKRRTFHEIFRILKPGGRLVVSDIVTDQPIPVSIKNNEKFRGECLGGALQQEQLLAMLRSAGFTAAKLIKRFPYRKEGGVQFYSLTFGCRKPGPTDKIHVIYRGPLAAVMTEEGKLLYKGRKTLLDRTTAEELDESFFIIGDNGQVTSPQAANSCCSQPQVFTTAPLESDCCSQQPLIKLEGIKQG